VRFSGFKVNSPDFAARRDGSRRGAAAPVWVDAS
jgi:hypothetical protein